MSGWDFDRGWYPPSTPRRVEGGLRARTTRGAIGASWWSRRFLDVLESFALGTRLTRGRAYARQGQVLSLDIGPGVVKSRVQGSRAKPYAVRIGLRAFPDAVWTRAEIALAEQALPSAKLLAGEVPPELEEIFTAAGAPLFPESVDDLNQSCSCPDWGLPCKHLAATFYLLAEAFDTDPFLILRWRGRDRDVLLGRLRELRAEQSEGPRPVEERRPEPAEAPRTAVGGTALALTGLTFPGTDAELDRFWLPPPPLPTRPPVLDVEPDLVLRQLPTPAPLLGGVNLTTKLSKEYRRLADQTSCDPA